MLIQLVRLLALPLLLVILLPETAFPVDSIDPIRPTPTDTAPKIDGRLDEPIWSVAYEVTDLKVISPATLAPASLKTIFKLTYDQNALYVGVVSEQVAETQVCRVSARDKTAYSRDAVVVVLDPSGNGRYGYRFEVALGGSLNDGTIRTEGKTSFSWDAPWRAATTSDDSRWYAEFEIPWDTMEWPNQEGKRHVGAFFRRHVSHLGEYWAVPAIPFTSHAFLSSLATMEVYDVNPGGRLTIYPYLSVGYDAVTQKRKEAAGADLFWQPSSNLLVSATVNPDFGQVENDDVVVNFSATETFLQDKRPFFVEGNDIFKTNELRLVHTRRIGQTPETPDVPSGQWVVGTPLVTDIIGAGKVTGQIDNIRYGIISAFEDDADFLTNTGQEVTLDGSRFYAGRLLYESNGLGKASIGAGYLGTYVKHDGYDAWAHAVDGQWLTRDKQYQFKAQAAVSNVDGEQGYAFSGEVNYSPRTSHHFSAGFRHVDSRFDINDMGYMGRNDQLELHAAFLISYYNLPRFKVLSIGFRTNRKSNEYLLSARAKASFHMKFHNNMELLGELEYRPDRWDDLNSYGNGVYRKLSGYKGKMTWHTDTSRRIRFYFRPSFFTEENGGISKRLSLSLGIDLMDTWQIGSNVAFARQADWILWGGDNRMNGIDADTLEFRIDSNLQISSRQEIRLGIQWIGIDAVGKTAYRIGPTGHLVESDEDVTANGFDYAQFSGQVRYRFEIAPLSDLFIVYTRGNQYYMDAESKTEDLLELLSDSFEDKDVDRFLVKIRYRF